MLSQITEIKSTIENLDAQRAQLEAALADAKVAAREHVVQTVRDMIAEAGFTSEEILPLVAPQPKGSKARASDGRTFPMYELKSDQSKTYARGVLPSWMKDAILMAGLDPSQGADRAKFKAEYMVQV